ncbi:amino acid permease [Pseudomonas sp. MAFF212428]|uniref:Amino acid permease n=1 Tax=Pseudomonas brassicae TaxID=2708063 RepID=A0A6M0CZK2_9PSED|nr:amino acid permease [Pseudomonas brassicae]
MHQTCNSPDAASDDGRVLKRRLENRHIQLISISGAIGTGLFMGSGKIIALSGTSIILVYAIIGFFCFLHHASDGRDAPGQPADGLVRRPGTPLPGATRRVHPQLVILAELGRGRRWRRGGGGGLSPVLVPGCAHLAAGLRHDVPAVGPEHARGESLW